MSVNSRLRPYLLAALVHAVLLAAMPAFAARANPNDLLAAANAALNDELYDVAEQYLKQYSSRPRAPVPEYIIMLARTLHGQKRYPEMLALLTDNRALLETGSQADSFRLWLARAYARNGQWKAALEQTADFEKLHPKSALRPDVIRLKAKILLNLGQDAEAIRALERLIKEHEGGEETLNDRLFLGQMLADSGRMPEACALLENMLTYPPATGTGQKCRAILGAVYMTRQEWQKARLAFEPLVNQDNIPDDYRLRAIESLAAIAVSQTNFSEALNILENGARLSLSPASRLELALRQGNLLLKMNKIDEGTALIHNYVSAQTTNAPGAKVQLELAQTLLAKGLNEKALVEFQNFLESFGPQADLMEANQGKGTALFNLARYHEAAAAFNRAAETAGNQDEKARCLYRVADALFASGQFKAAAETYAQAAASLPDNPLAEMALFQTAECLVQTENPGEAESALWNIYDNDPGSDLGASALQRIADILLQQNKLRAAETIYNWIKHDYQGPWPARAIYGHGMIAYRAGRFADALQRFNAALRLAGPGEVAAAAAGMAGWSSFMLNKPDEARRRFEGVVSSYPRSSKAPEALFWLSEHDYNTRHYAAAEQSFRRLQTEYPLASCAADALFWAGRSALMQNEFKRGRDYFSALIKQYPSSSLRPAARYFQGVALCELGQFDAAILIFNEIMKQYPDHDLAESAAFKKADCQFILGSDEQKRYEEACASYQLILDRPECSAAARLQAKYKMGRCLEKLGRQNDAYLHYMQVVYAYLQNQDQTPSSNLWFARAAFNAAAIMEQKTNWRQAVNIYERVVEADVPARRDAEERSAKLRAEHWLLFY